jgi:hypothetical protein
MQEAEQADEHGTTANMLHWHCITAVTAQKLAVQSLLAEIGC